MRSLLARLLAWLPSIVGMNTLSKQVFWILVTAAIAYPILKRFQQPMPPDPFNEPAPKPLGGVHCLLLGETALESYRNAWATAPAESHGAEAAATPGLERWSVVRERIIGEIEAAEHDCSVAASDRERQGIQAMRSALALARDGLPGIAGAKPEARGAAPPNQTQISEHLAKARLLLH